MLDINPKLRMIGTLQLSRAEVLMIVTSYLKEEKQLGVIKANFKPAFEDVLLEVESLSDDLPTRSIPVEKHIEIHNVQKGFGRPFYGVRKYLVEIIQYELVGQEIAVIKLITLEKGLIDYDKKFTSMSRQYLQTYLKRPDFVTFLLKAGYKAVSSNNQVIRIKKV